jgi:hypothetical protein
VALMNSRGDTKLIELHLRNGADARQKNNVGRSPYDVAMTMRNGIEAPFVSGAA